MFVEYIKLRVYLLEMVIRIVVVLNVVGFLESRRFGVGWILGVMSIKEGFLLREREEGVFRVFKFILRCFIMGVVGIVL